MRHARAEVGPASSGLTAAVVYEYMTNTNEKIPSFFLAAISSAWFFASATGGGIVQCADVTRRCVDVHAAAAECVSNAVGRFDLFDLLFTFKNFQTDPLARRFRIYANVLWPSVRRRLSCRCKNSMASSRPWPCSRRRAVPSIHAEGELAMLRLRRVDADVSGRGFIAESRRGRTASSEKRSLIAEVILVDEGTKNRFVQILRVNQAQHWASKISVCGVRFLTGTPSESSALTKFPRLLP